MSSWAVTVQGASQVVQVSWTSLVHLSAFAPWRLTRSDGVVLAKVVVARTSCDVPRDEALVHAPCRAPHIDKCMVRLEGTCFEGYSVGVRARAHVPVSV